MSLRQLGHNYKIKFYRREKTNKHVSQFALTASAILKTGEPAALPSTILTFDVLLFYSRDASSKQRT